MSTATREQIQTETQLVRQRLHRLSSDPLTYNEARLVISSMIFGGELHADWFLMMNSTLTLLAHEGLIR